METRQNLIDIYEFSLDVRNSLQEELKAGNLTLEVLKDVLKETEDVLYTRGEGVGEVVNPLDKERFIVKVDDGARYVMMCCDKVDKSKLIAETRVAYEMMSLIITRILPPQVNPWVYNMLRQDPGNVSYSDVGGLSDQIKDLRLWIERPLTDPEIFERVGVKPPKGVLLYGPPGTGKTLLARAIAKNIDSTFLAVASSAIVGNYLLVREMFKYARDHQPCIIFMDDIDAIGRRGSNLGQVKTSNTDRSLLELLCQLDGFDASDKVKVIMATSRPEFLDPALVRPGRIDKKIEFPLPNGSSRLEIFKIHASGITIQGEIDYENVVRLSEGFNGADIRNISTEAGILALSEDRDYIDSQDFIKAVRKLGDAKKLESGAQIQY